MLQEVSYIYYIRSVVHILLRCNSNCCCVGENCGIAYSELTHVLTHKHMHANTHTHAAQKCNFLLMLQ